MNNLTKVVMQLCPGGNGTDDLLIASPMNYHYATVPPCTQYLTTSSHKTLICNFS